jgi:hypothetical protein
MDIYSSNYDESNIALKKVAQILFLNGKNTIWWHHNGSEVYKSNEETKQTHPG